MANQAENKNQQPNDEVTVIIGKIRGFGDNQFAVTYPTNDAVLPRGTDITFSLVNWKGEHQPFKGQVAILSGVTQYAKGWRAQIARSIGPAKTEDKRQGVANETDQR